MTKIESDKFVIVDDHKFEDMRVGVCGDGVVQLWQEFDSLDSYPGQIDIEQSFEFKSKEKLIEFARFVLEEFAHESQFNEIEYGRFEDSL